MMAVAIGLELVTKLCRPQGTSQSLITFSRTFRLNHARSSLGPQASRLPTSPKTQAAKVNSTSTRATCGRPKDERVNEMDDSDCLNSLRFRLRAAGETPAVPVKSLRV